MSVLSQVLKTHVRCDICKAAYVHAEGDVRDFLIDHGWRLSGDLHVCPRCVRKARTDVRGINQE